MRDYYAVVLGRPRGSHEAIPIPVRVGASSLADEDGQAAGWVAILKDLLDLSESHSEYTERIHRIGADSDFGVTLDPRTADTFSLAESAVSKHEGASLEPNRILITGPSGSGKELLVKAIHRSSQRKSLFSVNCAALQPTTVEVELFGADPHAYTDAPRGGRDGIFQKAHKEGGTVFLDEIGTLPLEAQAKLLRLLENREVRRVGGSENLNINVLIIAATNEDLEQRCKNGRFREDLYHRLNHITLTLPPLCDRFIDVMLLADRFLREATSNIDLASRPIGFSSHAVRSLLSYGWPGNVRELRSVVHTAVNWWKRDLETRDPTDPERHLIQIMHLVPKVRDAYKMPHHKSPVRPPKNESMIHEEEMGRLKDRNAQLEVTVLRLSEGHKSGRQRVAELFERELHLRADAYAGGPRQGRARKHIMDETNLAESTLSEILKELRHDQGRKEK